MSLKIFNVCSFLLRRDFDRMVAAAVVARVEEAERRVAAALAECEAESKRADEAEARASVAEQAKIDMTLSIALNDNSNEASLRVISSLSDTNRRHDTVSEAASHSSHLEKILVDLERRVEEAELAAAVQVITSLGGTTLITLINMPQSFNNLVSL